MKFDSAPAKKKVTLQELAVRFIEALDGELLTVSVLARRAGVSAATVRRKIGSEFLRRARNGTVGAVPVYREVRPFDTLGWRLSRSIHAITAAKTARDRAYHRSDNQLRYALTYDAVASQEVRTHVA